MPPIAAARPIIDPTRRIIDLTVGELREVLTNVHLELKHEPTGPRLLDRRALAELLAVSLPSIDRLTREGLPSLRVGDATPRFEAERVIEWLRQRSTT